MVCTGKWTGKDKSLYEGEWKNGLAHGEGNIIPLIVSENFGLDFTIMD